MTLSSKTTGIGISDIFFPKQDAQEWIKFSLPRIRRFRFDIRRRCSRRNHFLNCCYLQNGGPQWGQELS